MQCLKEQISAFQQIQHQTNSGCQWRFWPRDFCQLNHEILIVVKAQPGSFLPQHHFSGFFWLDLWRSLLIYYASAYALLFLALWDHTQRIMCFSGSLLYLSVWYTKARGISLHRGILSFCMLLKGVKNQGMERNVRNNQNCCWYACQWSAVGRAAMRNGIKHVEASRKSELVNNCSLEAFNMSVAGLLCWEQLKCL